MFMYCSSKSIWKNCPSIFIECAIKLFYIRYYQLSQQTKRSKKEKKKDAIVAIEPINCLKIKSKTKRIKNETEREGKKRKTKRDYVMQFN